MSWPTADRLHRTAKLLIDNGKAPDPITARRYLERLVLQVAVGPNIGHDPAAQAALATAVNAGHRAYLGGVHVQLDDDSALSTAWTAGMSASETVARFGGTVVDHLTADYPTLALGNPRAPVGQPVLHLTWRGWSGGVVGDADSKLDGEAITSAGVAAAALGISEAFQQQLGAVVPGRRDVGVSLWRPDLDWREGDAIGPVLEYLPSGLWLLGLGHLGQAYAWTLGFLPYAKPEDVQIGLVDFDHVVEGNTATQLLARDDDVHRRKTRVVTDALEGLGFGTRNVERAFDEHFRPIVHSDPARNEPTIALAGFDKVEPRRQLDGAGFSRVVDGGLGAGPVEYLDVVVQTFPAPDGPATAFARQALAVRVLPAAYEAEIARQAASGMGEAAARCGMLDIAGVTVGAAFVGSFAGTVVIADLLRLLHGGREFSVVATDLRDPSATRAVTNKSPGRHPNPWFTRAR